MSCRRLWNTNKWNGDIPLPSSTKTPRWLTKNDSPPTWLGPIKSFLHSMSPEILFSQHWAPALQRERDVSIVKIFQRRRWEALISALSWLRDMPHWRSCDMLIGQALYHPIYNIIIDCDPYKILMYGCFNSTSNYKANIWSRWTPYTFPNWLA